MATAAKYMPPADADFNIWISTFSTLLSANPYLYGCTPTDAANVAAPAATWLSAYNLASATPTRTAGTIAAKDTARINAQNICRLYAQNIANNPGVSIESKTLLGINARTNTPTPITPPVTNPVLTVQSASNLSLIVRFKDSANDQDSKAKPLGVIQCQIFAKVSDTPITDVADLPLKILATKTPVTLTFTSAEGDRRCYLAARWGIRTGGVSPWSPIISFTVPKGS